jgi:hypothetical protein
VKFKHCFYDAQDTLREFHAKNLFKSKVDGTLCWIVVASASLGHNGRLKFDDADVHWTSDDVVHLSHQVNVAALDVFDLSLHGRRIAHAFMHHWTLIQCTAQIFTRRLAHISGMRLNNNKKSIKILLD